MAAEAAANTHGAWWCCEVPGAVRLPSGLLTSGDWEGWVAWPGQTSIVSVVPWLTAGMNPCGTAARSNSPGTISISARTRRERSLWSNEFTA